MSLDNNLSNNTQNSGHVGKDSLASSSGQGQDTNAKPWLKRAQSIAKVKGLTRREHTFVEAYCNCLDATKSARLAKYSEKSARAIGAENLTKPHIIQAISFRLKMTNDQIEWLIGDHAQNREYPAHHRLKGLETMAKIKGMMSDNKVVVNMFQGFEADDIQVVNDVSQG